MRLPTYVVLLFIVFFLVAVSPAQQASTTAVPNLISYSGTLVPSSGLAVPANTVGVTFAIYRQQDGGAPLWLETQNVTPDSSGHYSVLLGSTRAEGIPADLFNTQEQRWLGVREQGQAEQPRVLLVSVPYALKAADAETLAGFPASAFIRATDLNITAPPATGPQPSQVAARLRNAATPCTTLTSDGAAKANQVSKFTAPCKLEPSQIFDNGTNVGIGTSTPNSRLNVTGKESTADGTKAAMEISNTAGGGGTWYLRAGATGTHTPAGGFSIADTLAYRLVIDNTGSVGIGNLTPQAKLDVSGGDVITSAGMRPDSTDTNNGTLSPGLRLGGVGSGEGLSSPRHIGATNLFGIDFYTNNTIRMSITNGGFVGIGTTAPDNPLSVNGNADKPGGGSWGTFSDRRLKILNGNFTSGLDQILKLKPVRYRYKDDNALGIHDPQEHVGLVAQEVQRAIPEAVTENSKGYLLVNNDPILWAMLNAIKEQQGQIREQKEQIHKQQEQIRAQQAQIARLTRQVRVIQTSLNTNGRTGAEVRTVKAKMPVAQQ